MKLNTSTSPSFTHVHFPQIVNRFKVNAFTSGIHLIIARIAVSLMLNDRRKPILEPEECFTSGNMNKRKLDRVREILMKTGMVKLFFVTGMLAVSGSAAAYGNVTVETHVAESYKELRGYFNVRYNPYIDPANVRIGASIAASGQVGFDGLDEEGDFFYCYVPKDSSDFYKYAYDVAMHADNGTYLTVRTPTDGSSICSYLDMVKSSSWLD